MEINTVEELIEYLKNNFDRNCPVTMSYFDIYGNRHDRGLIDGSIRNINNECVINVSY